jgi:hypothetical protein
VDADAESPEDPNEKWKGTSGRKARDNAYDKKGERELEHIFDSRVAVLGDHFPL